MASPMWPILCSLLMILASGIQIPLTQSQFRCMLIYSVGTDETVKIDINFPHISGWTEKDKYFLTLRNTKSGSLQSQQVSYGHYRRQLHIYQKVIYEVCFQFLSPRHVSQEILVDYDADTHYMFDKDTIKLPENLLKLKEMQQTYKSALILKELAQSMIKIQTERAQLEQKQFKEAEQGERKIILVSILEIGLILGVAIYQILQLNRKLAQNEMVSFQN